MLVVVEVVTFVAIEAVAKMLRVVRWQPSAEEIPATEVQLQLHPPPLHSVLVTFEIQGLSVLSNQRWSLDLEWNHHH